MIQAGYTQLVVHADEAPSVTAKYEYVSTSELSDVEKAHLVSSLPSTIQEDETIYLVYQPNKTVAKQLPNTGDNLPLASFLVGSGLLLVAVVVKKRKRMINLSALKLLQKKQLQPWMKLFKSVPWIE